MERKSPHLRKDVTKILAADLAETRSKLTSLLGTGAPSRTVRRLESSIRQTKRVMVEINIPLAISIARSHCGRRSEIEDLVQDACLGLMRAVDGFSPARGTAFSTYAVWWIRRAVLRNISRTAQRPAEVLPEASGTPFEEAVLTKKWVASLLGSLDRREADVIAGRFGVGGRSLVTLDVLGMKLGLSKGRVRQIERRALSRLRTLLSPGGASRYATDSPNAERPCWSR